MISKNTVKLINALPKSLVSKIAKLIVARYLSKYANITVVNEDRLKSINKPVIFICNHLSNADGLILNKILKEKNVCFVAGAKLSKNDLTNLGLFVVDTISINPNSADKAAISEIVKLIRSGRPICIFPEGTRSRTGSMIKGKKGILLIGRLAKVPIVPIGIEGTEKLLPIHENDMGSEDFNHADVKVTIGEEFYIPDKEKDEEKDAYEERALCFVMRKIAELLPDKYKGEYKE